MIALALLAAAVWGSVATGGFVWDDEYYIVSNPAIRSWGYVPGYFTDVTTMAGKRHAGSFVLFRPVRNISFLIDFKLAGLNPAWWHTHNLALHLANSILVLVIARRLLGGGFAPLLAAALFLVHPVQSEAVAWAKCRDDLLGAFFTLLAFLLWLRWRETPLGFRRLATVVLLFVLACLSKIQSVVFPLLVAAYEFWVRPAAREAAARVLRRNLWTALACLAVAGAGCVIWRHVVIGQTAQSGYPAGTLLRTLWTMTRVGVRYLVQLVFPWKLLADYDGVFAPSAWTDWRAWGSLAVLLGVAFVTVRARRKEPVGTYGLLWVALCLLPLSNIVPTMQYMAERFLYPCMAGFALAVAALFRHAEARRPRAAIALALVILAALGARSALRVRDWRNGESLFAATVRDGPAAATRPRRNLLIQLINAGKYDQALPLARELWERTRNDCAIPARQRAEHAYYFGVACVRSGDRGEGNDLIRRALEIDPSYERPCLDHGLELGRAGNHAEALEWFDRAAQAAPDLADAHYNRGIALRDLGRTGEAVAALRRATQCGPETSEAHKSLAALLWSQGRVAETIPVYQEALAIWPHDEEIQHWLDQAREMTENP